LDISHLTREPATLNKKKPHPEEKRKPDHKTQFMRGLSYAMFRGLEQQPV